ncbi:LexA family transcriptional regulator [Pusillimonas sp. SM2304]|uniref:XRE family transcriptional regulator n=1 Tax=Pusillimonas sp. SM2304 TaxID=3073241 RepID=UPI0028760CED|nr:LexA family transcriptional regulator [Pusillimonas sp. SM2304]MDS1142415.1 LexA family transcriptional regulator [Pusillimonas sp. SM2304]
MTTIHDRIKSARVAKGFSMEKVAELVGVKAWQTVQQWENGGTAPKRKRLEKVAEVLDVTVDHLLQGAAPDGEHAPVKMIDAKASAGKGRVVFSSDVSKLLMFRKDWLRKNGAKADEVLAFPVSGVSMIDLHIPDGSVVLADTAQKEPIPKRLYVLWIDGELFVKQLVKVGDAWHARSHNAAEADTYPDIPIENMDDRIVGRAFWCGFGL